MSRVGVVAKVPPFRSIFAKAANEPPATPPEQICKSRAEAGFSGANVQKLQNNHILTALATV